MLAFAAFWLVQCAAQTRARCQRAPAQQRAHEGAPRPAAMDAAGTTSALGYLMLAPQVFRRDVPERVKNLALGVLFVNISMGGTLTSFAAPPVLMRAHVLLCKLAYYVEWHMREAWRELMFADIDQAAKATRDPVAPAKRSQPALDNAARNSGPRTMAAMSIGAAEYRLPEV